MKPAEAEADPHRFPCGDCGAALTYSPGESHIVCAHCGAANEIEQAEGPWSGVTEQDLAAALAEGVDDAEMEEARVIHCDACGADVEFDPETHAATCPFCASPVVAAPHPSRRIRPKGVLPFAIAEGEARAAMKDWLGSLWFAPSGLTDYARAGRPMQGLYVPYWTYDADSASAYRGQRGDVYYVTRTVPVKVDGKTVMQRRKVPKVRWTSVSGRVARFFDDVLVLASRSLPRKYADRLSPWDLSGLKPYQPAYLAGFRAEAYTVPLDEGFAEARRRMDEIIRRDIRFDIGGDQQRIDHVDTRLSGLTFKHILLPVWVAAYKYRGETYRFIVNGRTGEVQGERPWSVWKIALAVALAVAAGGAAAYLLARN